MRVKKEFLLSNRKINFQSFLCYLIFLFLPSQFGKHFWPPFSFVLGLRIDYLSPTVYLTDIFIILLLIIRVIKFQIKYQNINNFLKEHLFIFFFFLSLVIGLAAAKSPLSGVYGFVKLLEFIFFGFFIASWLRKKSQLILITKLFSLSVIFESVLVVWQYIAQRSIGGLFYFFGERTFTSSTPGIANASINGSLTLRPYGTFSHPNVLAGYLLLSLIFISMIHQYQKTKKEKIFFLISLILCSIAMFLTLSRLVILLFILLFVFISISQIKKTSIGIPRKSRFILGIILIVILFFSPVMSRFAGTSLSEESFTLRNKLTTVSLEMIKTYPLFGVGINNFLVNLPDMAKIQTVKELQPVHNIFLLLASETGIVGFGFLIWFIVKTYKKIENTSIGWQVKSYKHILLLILFVLGSFDHYFFTLQQGQLLCSFILAFCWAKIR